jgi:hypothetical protein
MPQRVKSRRQPLLGAIRLAKSCGSGVRHRTDNALHHLASSHGMQKHLQELDPGFYRETRLHIARVELEQLRQDRSAPADIERRSKVPLGISRSGDAMTARNR